MTVTKQQQLEWLASSWSSWHHSASKLFMSKIIMGCFVGMINDSHQITLEEWQQERAKMSSKPEVDNSWHERGELPPVGSTVEKKYKSATIWTEIKIVAAGNQLVIFGYPDGDESVGEWSDYEFRPLRTEREKAIDEMSRIMHEHDSVINDITIGALYDAGYRNVKP